MSKTLVVVESPAKAKTIEKFLGKNYIVQASMGHLRDLPKSQFGVDVEKNFQPKYINIRGKGELINSLKDYAKNSDKIFLATDPDREGAAIAWHLAHILNLDYHKPCRIEFHEITQSAIRSAIKHPRPIDIDRVNAQQTRRILDRIVGYQLSPLLWRKVRKGLSAGRVQSVAVRMICDREKEIQSFVPEEYWSIAAILQENDRSSVFQANLVTVDNEKVSIGNEDQAKTIKDELEQSSFVVTSVKRRERKRNPQPPFTTSSLQQEASRKLGFTTRKTMMLAQQLYEGLNIGAGGHVGLVTYIRTDSTRIADSAQQEARNYISSQYGTDYLPAVIPIYGSKKNSQDAHEAIRPTTLTLPPEKLASHLTKDQMKLYSLIWGRFIASQMAPAVYDTLTIDITANRFGLRASGSRLKFAGFMAAYTESKDEGEEEKEIDLPELAPDQVLQVSNVIPEQHFTQPLPRFTEASLVKTLEEKGIGRPSTYAPIIDTIVSRGYVEKEEKKFFPTELGCVVVELLKQYFRDIVDEEFTAGLEERLDEIADGKVDHQKILADFYHPFAKTLGQAETEIGHVDIPVEVSDTPCDHCGQMMVVKTGRYGSFLACPGFPKCRNTKPILTETGVDCPKCGAPIVERKTKRGKRFFGCQQYPQCDFVTWDMPIKENCPICRHFMVRRGFKHGGSVAVCGNGDCTTHKKEAGDKKIPSKNNQKTADETLPVKAVTRGRKKSV